MRRLLTIGLVLALAGLAVAQDAPRSTAAQRAITRHDQAMRKAEQEYQRAAVAAKRELIAELEQAKAQAMQAGQLDEANAIQAAIETATEELDRLMGKPQVHTFQIDATKSWQPTVEVKAGQRFEIKASGKWTIFSDKSRWSGPEGMPGVNQPWTAYLEGKIGAGGEVFRIGNGMRGAAYADGVLMLRVHDPGTHADNAGSADVTISLFP